MAFQRVNGITLRYEVAGRGPPLALIIGYRLHGAAWPEEFIERLARRFSVLSFDHRGTGLSDKPESGYELHTMASDLVGLFGHLGWPKAHILGFSMGGAIAQELAIRYPERAARLVLFATFPGGLYGVRAPWPVLRCLFELDGLSPEEAARQVWPVTYASDYLSANLDAVETQMHREIAYPTPPYAARAQREAIQAFSTTFRLEQIRAETMVATGAEDILVPPENSRRLAHRIPNARRTIIPGLGHRAIWEAPEEIAEIVTHFLQKSATSDDRK
jgi:pimeloyl-ACP methyl ester carboxylesterase